MDLTQSINIKPLRGYSEHEILPFYAYASATGSKGTIVTIDSAVGNTNVWQNEASPATPYMTYGNDLGDAPSRVTIKRNAVSWRVSAADLGDGDVPLGMLLYDVAETNKFGEKYIFRPRHERVEQEIVASGEPCPILCRGVVKLKGYSGTAAPNSGGVLGSGDNAGKVVVSNETTGKVGKFLSSADADGYALFKLEL